MGAGPSHACGKDERRLRLSGMEDIQLPLMLPALCSAAMLIFMDTVGDYGLSSTITAVYSYPTLPYTIYSAICTSPARFDMAGVLSLCLMLLIVLAMFIQYKALGAKRFDFWTTVRSRRCPSA
mgnify:CR=1 FL=1